MRIRSVISGTVSAGMKLTCVICLVCSLVKGQSPLDNSDAVITISRDYFVSKKVSLLTAFTCWNSNLNQKLFKSLVDVGIRVNYGSLDIVDRNQEKDEQAPLTSAIEDTGMYHSGIFVDTACTLSSQLLKMASLKRLFNIRRHWLLIDEDSVSYNSSYLLNDRGEEMLSDLLILPDSDIVWLQRGKDEVLLLDVYRLTSTSQDVNVSIAGYAKIIDGNVKTHLLSRPPPTRRRTNLHGALLKAGAAILFPELFTNMYDTRLKHKDTWTKITYPLVEYLSQEFNFTMEIKTTDSYGWQTNGSFDGLMGMLQRKEVELAASALFMRLDRMPLLDFAAEAYYVRTAIIFRQPTLASVTNIFTLPFSTAVWLCCVFFSFITLVTMAVQLRVTFKHGVERDLTEVTYSELFTYILGALCQQGLPTTPSSVSSRITVFVLSLTSLFLFTSYSANIVALLQSPSSSIRSVMDLVGSPLTLGIQDMAYNRVYLTESNDSKIRHFVRRKIAPLGEKAYCTVGEGMDRVRKGMFAYQVDTSIGYKVISETYTQREKCGLMEVELFPLPTLAVATAKNSGYREMFSQRIRWQREVGLLDRLRRLWLPQKPLCETMVSGFVSVGIIDFYPALMVLQYGIIAALMVLISEIIFHKRLNIINWFSNLGQKKVSTVHHIFWQWTE